MIEKKIISSTNTTTTKNYINGIGLDDLVAYEENNDIYYYHKNHLGSIEGITDNLGNIVVSYDYNSFGNFEITSGTDNGNTRLYTGREYDSEIGLYYLRARYYDSKLGRFISRDPIDIADDVNLYAYVGNNSLNYVDLMGTEGKPLINTIIDNEIASLKMFYNLGIGVVGIFKTGLERDEIYIYGKNKLDNGIQNYKDAHYLRNEFLIKFENYNDMIDLGYKKQNQNVNKYHRHGEGNELNTKYMPIDKKQEAIFNHGKNKFDYTDLNGATYNYGSNPVTHTVLDVIPYIILGNSTNDPTTLYERISITFK